MSDETLRTILAVTGAASPIVGLVGVYLGSWLGRKAARDERLWSESQTVRQRQEDAVARFDAEVFEATRDFDTSKGNTSTEGVEEELRDVKGRLLNAWSLRTVISDPEITRRFEALDMAFFIAVQQIVVQKAERAQLYPLSIGIGDLRKALAAFQRREEPEAAYLPTARELIRVERQTAEPTVVLGALYDLVVKEMAERGSR